MIESFFFYVLSIYFLYYVAAYSEILARPRGYLIRSFPWWVTKPLNCAFCFAFWAGVFMGILTLIQTGIVAISVVNLMAVPVGVMLLDALVKYLSRT